MFSKKNILEKYQQWAAKQSQQDLVDLYNIFSSLRGPDNEVKYGKSFFTGRVRYLFGLSDVFPFVLNEKPFPSYSECHEALTKIDMGHYRGHCEAALNTLKRLGIIS
jgi:hypothetical protein